MGPAVRCQMSRDQTPLLVNPSPLTFLHTVAMRGLEERLAPVLHARPRRLLPARLPADEPPSAAASCPPIYFSQLSFAFRRSRRRQGGATPCNLGSTPA